MGRYKPTHRELAIESKEAIKEYWRDHPEKGKFLTPNIKVDPETNELVSDMVDGYPPKVRGRAR